MRTKRGPEHLAAAVEAIYAGLDLAQPSEWLASILPPFVAAVGGGAGGYAHAYDLRGARERWAVSRPVLFDAPREIADTVVASFAATPAPFLQKLYGQSGPAGSFSKLTGMPLGDLPKAEGTSERTRVRDVLYMNAANPDGDGILLCANLSGPRDPTRSETRIFRLLAGHVAAAARIIRASWRSDPSAIFEVDGRAAHVQRGHEQALPRLRRRLVTIDRARARLSRDPDGALEAWKALLDGRYSLFDRFESDGRRYIVAHVNRPEVSDPRGLSETEAIVASWASRGHNDKLIAYELGVAIGTVSSLLARVYKKLGVRSRAELVSFFFAPERVERVSYHGVDVMLFSSKAQRVTEEGLTRTERAIAEAVAKGARNRAIAKERGVSEATIAKQLGAIYRKLGISTRAELARRSLGATPARAGRA